MVGFAGYEMPVQYPTGIIAEHLHTRAQAGLFDVSHMGQIRLHGAAAARALEALVPGDLQALAPQRMRYTLLLNETGGILDDLMATRVEDGLMRVAERLLAEPEVAPIGLGARDTLRLEAGLCLYGHDIDETTTPIEAALAWTIGKRRRAEGGFPGATTVLRQLAEGTARKRAGIRPDGRAPARDGTAVVDPGGAPVGQITSGGFGPSVNAPIAMGYVDASHSAEGAALAVVVRDVARPAHVVRLPFVPTRYYRPAGASP